MNNKSFIPAQYLLIIGVVLCMIVLSTITQISLSYNLKKDNLVNYELIDFDKKDYEVEKYNLSKTNYILTFLEMEINLDDRNLIKNENVKNLLDVIFHIENLENTDLYYRVFLKYKKLYLEKTEKTNLIFLREDNYKIIGEEPIFSVINFDFKSIHIYYESV